MRSWLAVLTLASTLGSAFALYAINFDTRRLEAEVQSKERALERAESDIAVLEAERAFLARPERIESAARALGLAPASARQIAGD
jgi:cell division protein FtsL